MCDSATPPAPSYLDLEMTVADLRAQLAAANEAREKAESKRDEYAMQRVAAWEEAWRTAQIRADAEIATLKTVARANQNAALDLTEKLTAAEARAERLEGALREIAVGLLTEDIEHGENFKWALCCARLTKIARAALAEGGRR